MCHFTADDRTPPPRLHTHDGLRDWGVSGPDVCATLLGSGSTSDTGRRGGGAWTGEGPTRRGTHACGPARDRLRTAAGTPAQGQARAACRGCGRGGGASPGGAGRCGGTGQGPSNPHNPRNSRPAAHPLVAQTKGPERDNLHVQRRPDRLRSPGGPREWGGLRHDYIIIGAHGPEAEGYAGTAPPPPPPRAVLFSRT